MKTPIGQCIRSQRRAQLALSALALISVAIDLWFAANLYPEWARAILATTVVALYVMAGTDRRSLGLRMLPVQPVTYWVRLTLLVAALMLIPILSFLAVVTFLNLEYTVPRIAPDQAVYSFVHMCLIAPVIEESIYRMVLCVPTTATFGSTGAIILSGATFAGLHFVYGNPGPDNFVAGYVLAWAYLKSSSIMVPITLHSLGNSVALAAQLTAFYAASPGT